MSDKIVQTLLEKALRDNVTPAIETAYENVAFKPTANTPYQRVEHLRATPENPEMTGSFKRLLGIMQVTLMYPLGKGAGASMDQAALIGAYFKKGRQITGSGVTVTVDSAPYVMAGTVDGDRWSVPVRIPYFANI